MAIGRGIEGEPAALRQVLYHKRERLEEGISHALRRGKYEIDFLTSISVKCSYVD